MTISNKVLTGALVFFLMPVFGLREAAADEVFDLGEIVVSPTRTAHLLKEVPVSTSVFTEKDIEDINVSEPADILENIPGLDVFRFGSSGSQSTVFMRGLYSVHTLVLQNGRPVNTPDTGTPKIETLYPFNIEKVEVVKGPHSLLYGANAVAGVINIIKKTPPLEKRETGKDFSYGSFNTFSIFDRIGLPLGKNKDTGFSLDTAYRETDGDRDNSRAEKHDAEFAFRRLLDEKRIFDFSAGYNESNAGNPGPRPAESALQRTPTQIAFGNGDATSLSDYTEDANWFADATFTAEAIKVKGYVSSWKNDFFQWYSFFAGDSNRRETENISQTSAVDAQMESKLSESHLITLGAAFSGDSYENTDWTQSLAFGTEAETSLDESRTTAGIFAQDEMAWEDFYVQAGVRYDEPSDYSGQLSPKGALLYSISDKTRARASIGTAFRAPTLSDLFWPEDAFSRGNPGLEPETSTAYDLGLEREISEKLLVRGSVFYQKTEDMIQWAPTGPMTLWGTPKWQPDNINSMSVKGFEGELKWKLSGNCDGSFSWTFNDAEQKNLETVNAFTSAAEMVKRDARFVPRNKAGAMLNLREVFIKNIGLNISAHYSDSQPNYYTDYAGVDPLTGEIGMAEKRLGSYTVVNAKLTGRWGRTEAFVSCNNLFDAEYATRFGTDLADRDFPLPGRNYAMGVSITF